MSRRRFPSRRQLDNQSRMKSRYPAMLTASEVHERLKALDRPTMKEYRVDYTAHYFVGGLEAETDAYVIVEAIDKEQARLWAKAPILAHGWDSWDKIEIRMIWLIGE